MYEKNWRQNRNIANTLSKAQVWSFETYEIIKMKMSSIHVIGVPEARRKRVKINIWPWLVWFSGLSTSLRTKGSLDQFSVRAHAWVAGQVSW